MKSSLIAVLWILRISWTILLPTSMSLSFCIRAGSPSWWLRANMLDKICSPCFAVVPWRWFYLPIARFRSDWKSFVFLVISWTAYTRIFALFYPAASLVNSDIEWSIIFASVINRGLWSGLTNSPSSSLEEKSSRTRSLKIKVSNSVYCESKAAV